MSTEWILIKIYLGGGISLVCQVLDGIFGRTTASTLFQCVVFHLELGDLRRKLRPSPIATEGLNLTR